ncbi:MAG: aminoglycoside phosphotransferase family protein [Microlunatus sp.]
MPDAEVDVPLTGGNMNAVVRRGDAVHRSTGPWTPTIHRLLEHLAGKGIDCLPRPLGFDEQGREMLTYLPGTVPGYPLPSWVWTDQVLAETGSLLARIHQASAGFDHTNAVWQLLPHEPAEVICLNDVAPYNMVFDDDHQLVGLIDLDTASPGPRVWDLAYLAYRLVPLSCAEDTGIGPISLEERHRRLGLLADAYATAGDQVRISPTDVLRTAVQRLDELAVFTADRAAVGATHVASHVAIYRTDAAWIEGELLR